jgi:hypothetical protein
VLGEELARTGYNFRVALVGLALVIGGALFVGASRGRARLVTATIAVPASAPMLDIAPIVAPAAAAPVKTLRRKGKGPWITTTFMLMVAFVLLIAARGRSDSDS